MSRSRSGRGRRSTQKRKPASWELQHSPYTVEGKIEGVGRFAAGVSQATGWRRRVAIGLALLFPVGIALALLIGFVSYLVRVLS